jgi:S-disulfanyl-L-cysteine oxidoreductase SoxD
MSKCRDLIVSAVLAVTLSTGAALAQGYGLGRPALPDEIAAWDVDVLPDGRGLPPGRGNVLDGEEIFTQTCAVCHGDFAEGVGNWPTLAGGRDTLDQDDPTKTVGSYWPYLSTLWDYINRSKPYGNAQSLEVDEVYALVAFLLYSNDIVDEEFELTRENFLDVKMPNADGFIIDDRPTAEYPGFSQEPCMVNCKPDVAITTRAGALDVTPQSQITPELPAPGDMARGQEVFKNCKSCHEIGPGAVNRAGPHLNGIFGRRAASIEGFNYSKSLQSAASDGLVWDMQNLGAYLEDPKALVSGTRMSFRGLKDPQDRRDVLTYLRSFSDTP